MTFQRENDGAGRRDEAELAAIVEALVAAIRTGGPGELQDKRERWTPDQVRMAGKELR